MTDAAAMKIKAAMIMVLTNACEKYISSFR